MQIAIISDTHLPKGKRGLPAACLEVCRGAELIIHAGDIATREVLAEIEALGETVAVRGNVDKGELRELLPTHAVVQVEGKAIAVVHNGGPRRNRLERLRGRFPGTDAVIFGHSHLPLHERAEDGFQIFNPGSPTERRRAPQHTMGLAHADAGGLRFELVALD